LYSFFANSLFIATTTRKSDSKSVLADIMISVTAFLAMEKDKK
jgi:hypothetical protein